MSKRIWFFLKTQLYIVFAAIGFLVILSPLALVSMTRSLWPLLLWMPMFGILMTAMAFKDDE